MTKFVSSRPGKCLTAITVLLFWSLTHTFAEVAALLKSAPVTLVWEPAEDQAVQGYGIYYGPTDQPATNYVNTGTNLSVTLTDLLALTSYSFFAVSYNADGEESVRSNELLLTPPVVSRVRISRLDTGEFRVTCRAAPGSVCQVEFADTPDSSDWQVLDLVTADAEGDVVVIDPASPEQPWRSYRVTRLSNPPPFTRLQLAKLPSDSMLVTLNGSPVTTWEIQYATSPVDTEWTTLTLVTANATGNASVLDPDSTSQPSRFYRAVLHIDPPAFRRLSSASDPATRE